ncbi:serine carboxypeptidase II-2-like [Neltuma alba]|uniref:serine carboxypeptidase II-2-like n=1 Tax=Neltuma alba TaxID=207710 RepID=UPI0010A2BFB5|nr:serine carboxypeptidase II-2-like [Prosopis alba]
MAKPNFSPLLSQLLAIVVTTLYLCLQGNTGFALSSSSDPFVQQEEDRVEWLPGQEFNVNFAHYAGYVKVNQEAGRALFYWFFEAASEPETKPLLLWLNGGPGCSSIGLGAANEIGPFRIKPGGKTLYLNPYSWNRVANLLFVDSPVGVGFSYSKTLSDIKNNGDSRTAMDSLEFLLKWLERFPQYKGRDFFISGESYAGHYVPQLSQLILKHNKRAKDKCINLKGYLVGNPLTDDYNDHKGVAQFLWTSGLISDQTHEILNIKCNLEPFVHPSDSCQKVLDIVDKEIGNLDQYSIFTPPCPSNVSQTNLLAKRTHRIGRLRAPFDPCASKHTTVYFNLPEVQKALHLDPAHKPHKWKTCSDVVSKTWKDSPVTVLDIYQELVQAGLRIWVFSGDTDSVLPVTSTRYSLNALKLPSVSPWRPWYDNGQVGGWTEEYEGVTFVVVRGAGHEIAKHKPKYAFTLIRAFISGTSMPSSHDFELLSAS